MAAGIVAETGNAIPVGMGQIAVARNEDRLSAILGSCVGVVLWQRRLRLAALAHVVLPHSNGREGSPGKFADLAIPAMLTKLAAEGGAVGGLVAKIAGGACMFGEGGPLQIGDANVAAVLDALKRAGVRVAGQDVGGKCGRRISICAKDGDVVVESVGQPARRL